MRILFLTPELPYPPRGGGTIKSATVLAYLKREHDVDVACLARSEWTEDQEAWAGKNGSVATVRLQRERSAANLVRSYAAGVPLSVLRNRSALFAESVRRQLNDRRYDAVFVDGWLMAQYLPPGFAGLKTLHQHNAEFVMWQRQASFESSLVRRVLVRREAGRVRRYESSILGRFDVVFAVSEADRRALEGLDRATSRVEVLPNVPEPGLLDRPTLTPLGGDPVFLYLATLSWQPNLQGLRDFIRDALPLLRDRLPSARLVVAGRGVPPELARVAGKAEGVDLVGPFEDPEDLYERARAFVEVARGGSGTRLKLLNALARGLPAVTTPDGAEGLAIRPGMHALVASSPAEFADALACLAGEDHTWRALSENGRQLIRARYVPEVAYRVLDEVFTRPAM